MNDLCFVHHSSCLEELEKFILRHANGHTSQDEALRHVEKLLNIHFTKTPQFSPKHIGKAQGFGAFEVYWFHMIIPNCNLSRTQFPKVYFLKRETHLCFLCLDSHIDQYKDAKLRKLAGTRLQEILLVLETHSCN